MILSIIVPFFNNLEEADHLIFDVSKYESCVQLILVGMDKKIENKNYYPKNVKIIFKDTTIYEAMNEGVFEASGTFIYFAGVSDRPNIPNILSTLDVSIDIFVGCVQIGDKKRCYGISKNLTRLVHHQAFICKTSLAQFDKRFLIYSDFDLMQKLLKDNSLLKKRVNSTFCIFKKGGTSSNSKNFKRRVGEFIKISSKHDKLFLFKLWFWLSLFRNISYLVK